MEVQQDVQRFQMFQMFQQLCRFQVLMDEDQMKLHKPSVSMAMLSL